MTTEIGYAVATIDDLKAIDSDTRVNGYIKSVTNKNSWYIYNATSSVNADDDLIIKPALDSDIGRWIKMYNESGTNLSNNTLPNNTKVTTIVTTNLTPNQVYSAYFDCSSSYLLTNIATTNPCRIRAYLNNTYATADAARLSSVELSGEHGCIFEVVTSTTNLNLDLSPAIYAYTNTDPSQLYLLVENLDTASAIITLTLTGKVYQSGSGGGFSIPTAIQTSAGLNDYFIGIDSVSNLLYKITYSALFGLLPTQRTYVYDGDTNGLFYYIGCKGGKREWSNPSGTGITITTSSIGSSTIDSFTDRLEGAFYSNNISDSWVKINIGTLNFQCNYYSIRNRTYSEHNLRNWKLQGSNNGTSWTDLDVQVNNTTFDTASKWLSLPVTGNIYTYSIFRLLQTGLNSSGTYYLCLGEIELYGNILSTPILPPPAPPDSTVDPYFSNVVNLLHFNGTNGSNVFTDQKGTTPVINGSPTISTAISKYGGASGLFSRASSDYIALPQVSFGAGDFTIETWVYLMGSFDDQIGICGQGELHLSSFGGTLYFWQEGGFTYSFGSNPVSNTWTHIAISRNDSFIRLFVNGTLVNSQANNINFSLSGNFNIGKDGAGNKYWNGYLDDFRITVGVGRYTDTFTLRTSQFPDS